MSKLNILELASLCRDYLDYVLILSASLKEPELKQTIIERLGVIQKKMLALEPQDDKPKHYLLATIGDIEPKLSGPFETEESCLNAAISHRQNDPDKKDGLFKLDIINGEPHVSSYCGGELEDLA
jgi:hypothetical protein